VLASVGATTCVIAALVAPKQWVRRPTVSHEFSVAAFGRKQRFDGSGGKTWHFATQRRTLPSAGILLELVAGVHLFTCLLLSTRPQAIIAHLDERCSQQLAVLAPLLAARSGAAQLFLVGGYGPRGESVAEEILKACFQGHFGRTSHNCKSARCTPSVAATVPR